MLLLRLLLLLLLPLLLLPEVVGVGCPDASVRIPSAASLGGPPAPRHSKAAVGVDWDVVVIAIAPVVVAA